MPPVTRVNQFGQEIGDAVGWAGAQRPAPHPMTGRFVHLRPLDATAAAELFAALAPFPELWTYQAEDRPDSIDQVAERIAAQRDAVDQVGFAILDAADGSFLGRVSYLRIQPAIGSIEVGGIILSPRLQRTRAATEVQYLLLHHAFEDLGYRRYEWKCDSLNAPSRSAAQRLGFTEEGTWRNALVMKGRNRDTTWYSITDADWPLLKLALESWLADDNFDSAGRQHASLAELRARPQS